MMADAMMDDNDHDDYMTTAMVPHPHSPPSPALDWHGFCDEGIAAQRCLAPESGDLSIQRLGDEVSRDGGLPCVCGQVIPGV